MLGMAYSGFCGVYLSASSNPLDTYLNEEPGRKPYILPVTSPGNWVKRGLEVILEMVNYREMSIGMIRGSEIPTSPQVR